jgi:hypothetical protein
LALIDDHANSAERAALKKSSQAMRVAPSRHGDLTTSLDDVDAIRLVRNCVGPKQSWRLFFRLP